METSFWAEQLGASSLPSESSHTLQKEKWVKWVRLFSSCGHTKDLWVKLVFDCFPGQTPQAGLLRRDCWVAQDEDCPNFCPYAFTPYVPLVQKAKLIPQRAGQFSRTTTEASSKVFCVLGASPRSLTTAILRSAVIRSCQAKQRMCGR